MIQSLQAGERIINQAQKSPHSSFGKVDRSGFDCIYKLVYSKKIKLNVEIEVDVPLDIIEDINRIKAVEDGLRLSISKGLYEQGVSFKINKLDSNLT